MSDTHRAMTTFILVVLVLVLLELTETLAFKLLFGGFLFNQIDMCACLVFLFFVWPGSSIKIHIKPRFMPGLILPQ